LLQNLTQHLQSKHKVQHVTRTLQKFALENARRS